MAIPNEHWFYYLTLEEELLETSKYVHFCEGNKDVNSYKFMEIIINVAIEFESLLKTLYSTKGIDNMLNTHLYNEQYDFKNLNLKLIRFDFKIKPFETEIKSGVKNEEQPKSPIWWNSGYNNIKHEKMGKGLENSTLVNALRAMGSLYSLLIFIYKHKEFNGDTRQEIFRDATTKSKLFHTPYSYPFSMVRTTSSTWMYNVNLQLKDNVLIELLTGKLTDCKDSETAPSSMDFSFLIKEIEKRGLSLAFIESIGLNDIMNKFVEDLRNKV